MAIVLYRREKICKGAERLCEMDAVLVAGKRERNDEFWASGECVADKRDIQRGCCQRGSAFDLNVAGEEPSQDESVEYAPGVHAGPSG
ncbi:Hypothetical protein Cp1002B_1922 [Corynebacterium pseudotuberculosis]|nr:Hypothetical protein Cp4202_0736 [Corynebacterium pseudotuberculosis 42/02-A]AFH51682.1 Hypothetical protein Cp267_0780 [Corynebacterium pseudotuberculosis 267]AJC13482.1 Hypothetical protein CpVD57_0761 [Corynebacterium pseudotuberculosis]AKJ55422.1 Hypothetical protein Cp12C_0793 [Corynebacterium pseudotuberculosis]ALF58254.1 hypothetical protein AN902_09265 [Corynebacterium pseudotuberculosis]